MAKKKKTSYKCGHCNGSGHNARTCPDKVKKAKAPEAKPEEEAPKKTRPERVPNTVPVDASGDLLNMDRTGPSRPTGPGCFQCPKCNRASILVLVQLPESKGGTKEMRCELCHNKTPIEQILLWGAQPADTPAQR